MVNLGLLFRLLWNREGTGREGKGRENGVSCICTLCMWWETVIPGYGLCICVDSV